MDLRDIPGLLTGADMLSGVILVPLVARVLAHWIWGRRRGLQVYAGVMAVMGVSVWATADPGSAARLGLAALLGLTVAFVVMNDLLDGIWARFQSPERRAQMLRPQGAWVLPPVLAAALAWIWFASVAGGPEREVLLMTLSQGAALFAGLWGAVMLARMIWRTPLQY